MKSRLKVCAIFVGLAFGLSGCVKELAKINNDLASLNHALAGESKPQANAVASGGTQNDVAMAAQPEAGQSKPVQLIVPSDKRVVVAIDEALPTIKKILAIHQCVKNDESMRQMNFYAVPGVDMAKYGYGWGFPNSTKYMNYHDRNKCVSVSTIDQWIMPALNALQFRAVYFADDSGETVNFTYIFTKVDDGSWKIADFRRPGP